MTPTVAQLPVKIYNLRDVPVPDDAIIVDRSSVWGNPFYMHEEKSRDSVCDAFEKYARERAANDMNWLAPLRGKNLACWCAPKRCHAETLARLAND